MTYSVSIKRSALKALERIGREDRLSLVAAIDKLRTNPSAGSVLKGEFAGLRRIRVGVYRVVYEVREDVLVILVVRIGHRREVYR
jgi:mRNA interferase RelE/StbE